MKLTYDLQRDEIFCPRGAESELDPSDLNSEAQASFLCNARFCVVEQIKCNSIAALVLWEAPHK